MFSDLKEQSEVADRLQRSLRNGRLAHAYLLIGPRGSGKEAVARTLAQALNCEQQEHDACGRCDSCQRIAKGIHPDIHLLKPESKSRRIKIEQIREFENIVRLRPNMARIKVGIVLEADCLQEQAANAFLKTLEEPPARTVILLLTAEPQRLLPTILSRCLRLTLGRTAAAESAYRQRILPLLVEFAGQAKPGVAAIYRFHAALTKLLEQIKAEIGERLKEEEAAVDTDNLEHEALEKLEDEAKARLEGEWRAAREQVLQELFTWFSDILLCVENAPAEVLEHPEQLPVLQQAAAGLSHVQAERQVDAILQIRDALARNITEAFAIEVGLLKLVPQAPRAAA
jgi:DNA polymerase-3 subunit delta'